MIQPRGDGSQNLPNRPKSVTNKICDMGHSRFLLASYFVVWRPAGGLVGQMKATAGRTSHGFIAVGVLGRPRGRQPKLDVRSRLAASKGQSFHVSPSRACHRGVLICLKFLAGSSGTRLRRSAISTCIRLVRDSLACGSWLRTFQVDRDPVSSGAPTPQNWRMATASWP